ncbi:MAG: flagellar protein FlaG [Sulfurospirillaceae bacterium]|nr:flagellar protein FlaG [Sulfurospirillaceae bacterium]
MDIFSVTGKQAETSANVAKVSSQAQVRQVEQTHQIEKSQKEGQQDKQEMIDSLNKTVDDLNNQMGALETNVRFGFNDKISTMFVNVMERSTGKMIRKIPTEEAMKLSERMKEIVGMIFDKKG